MEPEELIKKRFAEYRPAVSEQEWELISQDTRLLRYNKMRRLRKIRIGGGVALFTAAAIVTAVLLLNPEKQSTPVRTTQPNSEPSHTTLASTPTEKSEEQTNPSTTKVVDSQTETITSNIVPEATSVQNTAAPTINSPAAAAPTSATVLAPKATAQSTPIAETRKPTGPQSKPASPTSKPKAIEPVNAHETPPEPENPTTDFKLFVPSAFTPNGDGLNDLFLVTANFEPSNFDITIFNRSSEKLFHSRSINIGWDGTKYGTALPQGVYLYVIKYATPEGKTETQRGQILLIK